MENLVVGRTQNSKILYRELCANEDLIPLFSWDWWLDTVVGVDKWDVASSMFRKTSRRSTSVVCALKAMF